MKYIYLCLIAAFLFVCSTVQAKDERKDNIKWYNEKWAQQNTVLPYVDTMIGLSYIFEPSHGDSLERYILHTMRPYIGFGIRPFLFLDIDAPSLEGLGFGFHTMIFSSGLTMYYSHPNMWPVYLAWTIGWDRHGNTIPGCSAGARF
jgi:hypothetical protein